MASPDKKPKTKLSIYLIKEDIVDIGEIIKPDSYDNREDLGDQAAFFSKISQAREPKWVRTFFRNGIDSSALQGSSASGVLVLPVNIDDESTFRIFALSFGYGHNMISKDAIEPRFGLITALNLASSASLRAVKGSTVAGTARKTAEQLPLQSSIDDFSLDVERDLLEGVTIKTKPGSHIEGTVTGADSLSIAAAEDIDSVEDFLSEVFATYLSDDYKESFSWVDRIAHVKTPLTITTLENRAVELLNEESAELWFAVPEVIDWEEVEGFKIIGDQTIHDDILTEDILQTLQKPLQSFSALKRRYIQVIDTDGSTVRKKWRASECLYGEFQLDGKQYCINNGKWYVIDQDYVTSINSAYEDVPISTIDFPECRADQKEADYNQSLAEQDTSSRILMDAKNISLGGGRSRIELCDVLFTNGTFAHIKVYTGSSALSHLFNQGYVSSQLVRSDSSFRQKAQKEIDDSNSLPEYILSRNSVQEVVFGIISKDAAKKPTLPFFSKITLEETRKRLASMNIRVSIRAIQKKSV